MSTTEKRITITLTDSNPVSVLASEWPVIAQSKGDNYNGNDYGRHQQALAQNEVDTYTVRVRQHADGRAIVSARLSAAAAWTRNESWAGGRICQAGADLAGAIRDVCEGSGIPDSVIRDAIADLPAVEM